MAKPGRITAGRPDLGELLDAAIRGGVDIVQIRDRNLSDREVLDALAVARHVTRGVASRSS